MNPRRVFIYRGFHSNELFEILKSSWSNNDFVALLPLQVRDFSFLQIIKSINSNINLIGDWPDDVRSLAQKILTTDHHVRQLDQEVLSKAVLGVFTSGTTTGRPRLVFYSKENISSSLESIRELFDIQKIKNIFVYPQPTHCFGLILGYMQSIVYNCKINFSAGAYTKKAHAHWLETVDEHTLTLGAPVHFLDLIEFSKVQEQKIKSSYSAIIGGAPVTQKLWLQVQNDLLIRSPSVGYGGTEASPGLSHLPPGERPIADGDIGYPLKNVKINLGEKQISFSGPNACLAVYDSILIKTEFDLALSDVIQATVENDGRQRLQFIGRSDLLVNRGGQKTSLEKIESQIADRFHFRCAAISFYDVRLGQDIALIIETESGKTAVDQTATAAAIQKFIQSENELKIPIGNIVFAPLPLNQNKKVDRKEGLKLILKNRSWSFPIDVAYVKTFLPHDGQAVWIDRIISTEINKGVTETTLKESGTYFVNGFLSESSFIEFVAQSFGYTLAMNDILDIQNIKTVTTTLIAEVKDSRFYFNHFENLPQAGDCLRIETVQTHDFGALKVVQGRISFTDQTLATLNMKLYCN